MSAPTDPGYHWYWAFIEDEDGVRGQWTIANVWRERGELRCALFGGNGHPIDELPPAWWGPLIDTPGWWFEIDNPETPVYSS
jgi:hypothetical protein